eukprot:5710946-Pleurochrysis_carterae.AAC.1
MTIFRLHRQTATRTPTRAPKILALTFTLTLPRALEFTSSFSSFAAAYALRASQLELAIHTGNVGSPFRKRLAKVRDLGRSGAI